MKPDPDGDRLLERNRRLLDSIKKHREEIGEILRPHSPYNYGEDFFYRLYHGSFKVYLAQKETERILRVIRKIGLEAGQGELNPFFLQIINEGTGKEFSLDCNLHWGKQERPVMEAFFHAREMLALMAKYADKLDEPPLSLPSGWAAVLYLYNMR